VREAMDGDAADPRLRAEIHLPALREIDTMTLTRLYVELDVSRSVCNIHGDS
jgi:hypothetical protein